VAVDADINGFKNWDLDTSHYCSDHEIEILLIDFGTFVMTEQW